MSPPIPSFTVFDVETTGLDPKKGHRIIEIAGVRIDNFELNESKFFLSLVNPERPIPWEAKQVNKISDEDVRMAPTIEEVLPKFLEFAQGSILVAHNALFDMNFLEHEKEFCWGYIELPECLCTLQLSRAAFPNEFAHNLDAVSRRLCLTIPANRHRALPDVLLTANALIAMIDKCGIDSLEHLRGMASLTVATK